MPELIHDEFLPGPEAAGRRLDQILAERFPEHSRARLQQWIRSGDITVDGKNIKPGLKLRGTETIAIAVRVEHISEAQPQEIPIDVVHADDHVVVINKSAGLVVHPAAGNPDGTLQNALLHRFPELSAIPRAGIVHRLDRLTSGVMVVARSLVAHTALVRQLQDRSMSRRYLTLVHRPLIAGGRIEARIGRHPRDRKRQAVVDDGKEAVTHYRVEQRFRNFTLLEVHLETGRTHQIRVHMAHIKHAVVGDPVYGMRLATPAGAGAELIEALRGFRRQALHAAELRFLHPEDQRSVDYRAPIPADMTDLLELLNGNDCQRV